MNVPHTFIGKIILAVGNDPFFENITLTTAYENDIKPYPVTQPIIAFAVDKVTVGDRLVEIGADGAQTVSNTRVLECVIKASIFVPYDSGAEEVYRLADYLYSMLLFQSNFDIPITHFYDSNYVRECGALVLETDFTLRHKESS